MKKINNRSIFDEYSVLLEQKTIPKKGIDMKNFVLIFLGCVMLLSVSSTAYSALYLNLNHGPALLDSYDVKGTGTDALEYDPDVGFALAGAIGYQFDEHFRMDAEIAWQQNYMYEGSYTGNEGALDMTLSGDMTSLVGLLNGYYDVANQSALTPFLTVGIGFGEIAVNDLTIYSIGSESNPWPMVENLDGTSIAYQVGGGFNYAFCETLSLDLKYRYFATLDLELDGGAFGSREVDYSSHNVYGCLRFTFQ